MRFFTGLHQPSDAQHFDAAFVSVNRLRKRKGPFKVGDWIMDSGAFTEISTHGHYRTSVAEYAAEIRRWKGNGNLLAAASQDWMCEEPILKRAALAEGIFPRPAWWHRDDDPHAYKKLAKIPWPRAGMREQQIAAHQRRTIERYDALVAAVQMPEGASPGAEDSSTPQHPSGAAASVYILPVLQGFAPADYVTHLRTYGERLAPGAWVGVGSICKRNGDPAAIARVLDTIKTERPDLRLHGFGLKTTALAHPFIRSLLYTADSMAWSFAARMNGGNGNDWREAMRWASRITDQALVQPAQQLLLRIA